MKEIDSEAASQPQGVGATPETRPADGSMVIWMVGLTCLWGLNAIGIKAVTDEMPPLLAVGLRGLVALVLMVPFALWRRERLGFTGWQWVHGLVVGVLFALEFALFYVGAQYTSGGHMVIFINTAPFFVAAGAHLFLPEERLSTMGWLGLTLAFFGIVAVFSDDLLILKSGFWRGDLLVILAAMGWGMTTLYMKRFMVRSMTGFHMLYAQILVSTPLLLGMSFATESFAAGFFAAGSFGPESLSFGTFPADGFAGFTALGLGIVLFQAVVVVVFSYMAWMTLLRVYPASAMQSFTFLTPVWGVLLGAILLGETITVPGVAGLAMVGAGLVLISRPRPGPS